MKSADNSKSNNFQKSNRQYKILLDSLVLGVQENNCDGIITYSNRGHHNILGYEYGELIGKAIWDLVPTDDEKISLKEHFSYLVKEQPLPVPYITRCMKKGGTIVHLQIDWNFNYDEDGALNGFISVISDITSRKETEDSLISRTQGLATLLEASSKLAATLDLEDILQATVDGVTELVGLDTAAVYLLEGDMLYLWATQPQLPKEFPNELRTAQLANHPHIHKAVTSCLPLLVPDITKEKLTSKEQTVVDQRNLRTVLYVPLIADESVMGAFIVGSAHKTVEISDVEINLSCTLGNLAALAVKNAQLYREGKVYAGKLEKSLKDRIRAEEEREALQEKLIQSQKLESIGRLAGGVAHDFNNMLSVILGYSELAMNRVDPSDRIYTDLQAIRKGAERSAGLTQQLLAFARKQTAVPRVLDLNETIGSMLKMLRRLISEDIDLEFLPGAEVWPVMVDPVQVDQVLVNLCINARDSIDGAGKVTIETGNSSFDEESCLVRPGFLPGEYTRMSVSDNGCGMDRETQEKLFEPFFTTKGLGKGTGLGLSMVYGIVKQNRGFINVYSEPGKGTTIKIYLPRHYTGAEKVIAEKVAVSTTTGWETVLIVEDEPELLTLCMEMLEAKGYNVLTAATPEDAVRIARENNGNIHILITDVIMPVMNGRELARELEAICPGIKCLFMSGYTDNVITHHGVLDKGVHFIHKPFSSHELAVKVRQALGHKDEA